MRYRFRGLLRETGKPVEGHVEAPTVDQAYGLMADNGIVCESLKEDPRLGDYTSETQAGRGGGSEGDVATAIDSALDTSSTQVNVDDLWRKYRGQRVRVIDRDKIRNRVLTVVTNAIKQSGVGKDDQNQTLERVEAALGKMFGDNKNLTSEVNPANQGTLSEQMATLTDMVMGIDRQLGALSMQVKRGGGGGGGGRGRMVKQVRDDKNDKVLLEIFETNVKLQRKGAKGNPVQSEPAAEQPAASPQKE